MPSAYQSRPYDDRYSSARMSDLMREAGAVQAQGIQQRGQNTAATIGRMGDLLAGAVTAGVQAHRQTKAQQEVDAKKAEEQRIGEAVKSAIDPATGRLDFGKAAAAIGQIDPLRAEAYWEKADEKTARQAVEEAKKAAEVARGLGAVLLTAKKDKEAGPGALQSTPPAYRSWRADAVKRGIIDPDDFPEEYDEAAVQQQALFKYLPAAAVFEQLFKAKNAPKTTVLNPNDVMVDESGRKIAENPRPVAADRPATATVDGRIVDTRTGKVIYTSPDAGRSGGGSAKPDVRSATALQDDIAAAEKWKISELNRVEAARKDGTLTLEQLYDQKDKIQHSYLVQIGAPEATQRMQAEQRRAERDTMRGLVNPPQNAAALPAGPPRTPTAPLGAARANADPAFRSGATNDAGFRGRADQPAPPDPIALMLRGQKPGRYRMSDGSVWLLTANGQISQVQ